MNPKFKELALKANLEYDVFLPDAWSGENKDLEKFAELIVKECAEQIIIKGTDWIDWMPSQMGVSPEYYDMAQHVKTHFGIE